MPIFLKDSSNMIVMLMNKILPTKSQELLTVVEPIIEKIVKQEKFNPNIKDDSNFSSNPVAWLGKLGADFLEKCIKNMQTKLNVNLEDKTGMTALHWSSDYNDDKVVKVLVENGGNVNSASSEKYKTIFPVAGVNCTVEHELKATSVHHLFLNKSGKNSNAPKLPTLKVLLNKDNKPPFDPSLKMLGNKTAADILEAKKAVIVDYNDCHNALDEYTTWYNNDYTVASLGQQLEEFGF
ncbi:MAG: ankyrin repeat domain-containing protein [Rickettsia endosymbiont of Sceptobius lativentris]|nr:ankyrin repeat domain-containing protein [Rickettsia endosymbiont of Sceptobius lativentris]